MPCYRPVQAFYSDEVNPSGKRSLVFNQKKGYTLNLERVQVPCGKCIGCLENKSREWAIRCYHESQLFDSNCFITLTLDDEFIPKNGSLVKSDFQNFLKRLRRMLSDKPRLIRFFKEIFEDEDITEVVDYCYNRSIRYFHCGEYGRKLARPHHHCCLFNFDFPDKYLYKDDKGKRYYRSPMLESIWTDPKSGRSLGFCILGNVSFESAAYIARYTTKKVRSIGNKSMFYDGKLPEYITMSRRPGVGSAWFDRFKDDIYPADFVVVNKNRAGKPPKFYDKKLELTNYKMYAKLVRKRKKEAEANPDNSLTRLRVREIIKLKKFKLLERSLENGAKNLQRV